MKYRAFAASAVLAAVCAMASAVAVADDGPPPRMGMGPGFGGPRGPDLGLGRPLPPGVKLTEAQEDKVFAILHGAEPARRDHQKAIRKAHEALRAVHDADKFDEAKAAAAAKALGDAMAASALQEARVHAQVQAVLTPEQRKQMAEARKAHEDRMRRGEEHGERFGRGPWGNHGSDGARGYGAGHGRDGMHGPEGPQPPMPRAD